MNEIMENIQRLGPVFAVVWGMTIASVLLHPQRFRNSILLMGALLVTMVFLSGFFGETAGPYFLLACFLLAVLALLLVPVLLILNGIQMIRRESICPAHLLSLGLGIVVGIGEIATVVYVLGLSDFIRLGDANPWVMLVSLTVFYFSFLVLSFVVYCVFIQIMPHRMNFNYIVIHGCGLAGGEKLSKLLSNRVDKAVEIYRKCASKPVIIPSGGRGSDEKLSEAQAMKDYLLSCGIPEESIVLEDRSTTTRENILFSKEIIESRSGGKKTALISSNYHIYRCLRLAREAGFKCIGIGANVAMYYWPSAIIREFVAIFVTKGFLIWALIGYLMFVSPALYSLVR
ncbi:MAG: YdcF family protein [Ruminococcaceae bacterium]|nr:YdcF family protein [Oscillospiraceae bacterium]